MSNKIKAIIAASILFVFLILGTGYYISSKLKPEELKLMALDLLSKQLPNADISLSEVNVKAGFTFTLGFSDLKISLKEGISKGMNPKIVEIKNFNLNIPVWAILTGGGTVTLVTKNPIFYYSSFGKDSNNLALALGKTAVEETSSATSPISTHEKVNYPEFISKSSLNVKVEDLVLEYDLAKDNKGSALIPKFVLKDFNLTGPSAFEVAMKVKKDEAGKGNVSADILTIGQLDMTEFSKNEVVGLDFVANVTNIVFPKAPINIPSIKNTLKVKYDLKDSSYVVSLDTLADDQLFEFKSQINGGSRNINLKDILLKLKLSKLTALANDELKKSLAGISFDNYEFVMNGSADYELESGEIKPDLTWDSNGEINQVIAGATTHTSLKGSLKLDKLQFKAVTKLFSGSITSEVKGNLDYKALKQDPMPYPFLEIAIAGANLNVDQSFISTLIYSKKEGAVPEKSADSTTASMGDSTTVASKEQAIKDKLKIPDFDMKINFVDVKIGSSKFSMDGKVNSRNNFLQTKDLGFNLDKGTGKITLSANVINPTRANGDFSFVMSKINLSSFNAFLPKTLKSVSGNVDSKTSGTFVKSGATLSYNVVHDSTASNGKIDGLNLASYVKPYLDKVEMLKGKLDGKDLAVSDEFESFVVSAKATEKKVDFSKIYFVGIKNMIVMTGNGSVGLNPGIDSELLFDVGDNKQKLGQLLQKNIGRDTLPVRLTGKGMEIGPDVAYSLKAASSGFVKTKGKETVEKIIKEKVLNSEQVDKLIKNPKVNDLIKKNSGKLLDGLFGR